MFWVSDFRKKAYIYIYIHIHIYIYIYTPEYVERECRDSAVGAQINQNIHLLMTVASILRASLFLLLHVLAFKDPAVAPACLVRQMVVGNVEC